ncbi:ABC transporter ATP-binding protein [Chloroflexota bacterium]
MLKWPTRKERTARRNGHKLGSLGSLDSQSSGSNGHGITPSTLNAGSGVLSTGAMIDLQGITKVYQTDAGPFPALKDVNLEVYPGEFVAVVGKSGCGKSTLINMFTGIDHPSSGQAIVAGTFIGQLDEGQMAEWRGRYMGIVFQFFQLLPTLTIAENVMLPMDLCQVYAPEERYERALYRLEQVGIAEAADKFPSVVSGGEQQRAAIARALANDPPILVADEPTGNLDSKTADSVFALFESLVTEGKTILMVTHDEELASRVPRTITLADGLIVAETRHAPAALLGQPTMQLLSTPVADSIAQHTN